MVNGWRQWVWWIAFLFVLPITIVQGIWLRRSAPRMPPLLNNGDQGVAGSNDASPVARLLVAGESTAVGVGCKSPEQSMTVQIASALSAKVQGDVAWQVIGENGARAADVALLLRTSRPLPSDPSCYGVILLGVNDVTKLSSLKSWREDLTKVVRGLRARGASRVYLAPVPPVWQFTLLPQPLRWLFGERARMLDHVRKSIPDTYPYVFALETDFPTQSSLLAQDGYHPGPEACRLWSQMLIDQVDASRLS